MLLVDIRQAVAIKNTVKTPVVFLFMPDIFMKFIFYRSKNITIVFFNIKIYIYLNY